MLALNTFALGKEVVISRGELVEIGGSFRVPEILERSGARLREVGTTNKTRLADYAAVVGAETGAILRVHPSNFRVVGFTESAATEDLVRLGRERGLPVIEDFGSGNLLSLAPYGLPGRACRIAERRDRRRPLYLLRRQAPRRTSGGNPDWRRARASKPAGAIPCRGRSGSTSSSTPLSKRRSRRTSGERPPKKFPFCECWP